MANQQAIHWFSGFFEGEGCFSIRQRNCRGKNAGIILEPKISVSNTNRIAMSECENLLNSWILSYSISVDQRANKLPCYNIDISRFSDVKYFCDYMEPHLECDRERCILMKDFCNSRLSRTRYSSTNQHEFDLYSQFKKWRASETVRSGSFNHSLDWLAGVCEAEASLQMHVLHRQLTFQVCNTNNLIVEKVDCHLQKLQSGHHLKCFSATNKHQSYWHVTIYGTKKVQRFWKILEPHLRFRREEWAKIMSQSGL